MTLYYIKGNRNRYVEVKNLLVSKYNEDIKGLVSSYWLCDDPKAYYYIVEGVLQRADTEQDESVVNLLKTSGVELHLKPKLEFESRILYQPIYYNSKRDNYYEGSTLYDTIAKCMECDDVVGYKEITFTSIIKTND